MVPGEMDDEHVVAANVSLYPRDWDVVDQVKERYGQGTRSAALRLIIRDWVNVRDPLHVTYQPAPAE